MKKTILFVLILFAGCITPELAGLKMQTDIDTSKRDIHDLQTNIEKAKVGLNDIAAGINNNKAGVSEISDNLNNSHLKLNSRIDEINNKIDASLVKAEMNNQVSNQMNTQFDKLLDVNMKMNSEVFAEMRNTIRLNNNMNANAIAALEGKIAAFDNSLKQTMFAGRDNNSVVNQNNTGLMKYIVLSLCGIITALCGIVFKMFRMVMSLLRDRTYLTGQLAAQVEVDEFDEIMRKKKEINK